MTRARRAALTVVALAVLAAPQSASAGASSFLAPLSQANGILGAEWITQPGTSSFELELSPDTIEDVNGYWTNGTRISLSPTDTSTGVDGSPGNTYNVRVWTATALDVCAADPTDPQCDRSASNTQSITMAQRTVTVARLTGLSQAGGVISASWDLPAETDAWEIHVSTSTARRPSGYFEDEIRFAPLARRATSFTFDASTALPPGTYYAHIFTTPTYNTCAANGLDPACIRDYSNILPIKVVPSGSALPPPPASLTASDKALKLGTISARSSQDIDKLSITLTAGEAVKVKLSGSVNVPGASKVYRFKTVNKSVGAGKTKLSLKLAGKAKKAVKRALKRKKKLKAKLTLVITDAAGNAQTKKYTVRLKR